MKNHEKNARFLNIVHPDTKRIILRAIAEHYGISVNEAEAEVTGEGAEHLLDYLTGSIRTAASLQMRRYNLA